MIGLRVERTFLDALDWPALFPAPVAWCLLERRARRMPVAHVNRESWLVHDSGVATLQPLIEPAHGLVAPLHAGPGIGLVRPGVVPGAHHPFHRSVLHVLEHARDAVAVAVVPAADEKARDFHALVLTLERRAIPELAVALLLLVSEHPRLRVEAVPEVRLVNHEIWRTGTRGEVHAHLPGIQMHDSVYEVHVILVEILRGIHRNDRFECGRVAHGHLDGVEPAP